MQRSGKQQRHQGNTVVHNILTNEIFIKGNFQERRRQLLEAHNRDLIRSLDKKKPS